MNIGSWDSNSINTLFSSLPNAGSNNSMASIYSNLSEMNSIKSGAYGKLTKSYYAKDSDKTNNPLKDKVVDKKENDKRFSKIESSADKLVDASKDLYSDRSLWTKKDGAYDTEKIYSAVSEFVNQYNNSLSAVGTSEENKIVSAASSMVNLNTSNQSLLEKLGITMDKETFKLSINAEAFKKADMSTAKTLFSGTGSYAYQMGTQASMLRFAAQQENSSSSTYTHTGTKSKADKSGTIYDNNI